MSINQLDSRWDNQTLNYDLEKHNWPAYWLSVAQDKFPQIEQLETIHEVLSPREISELGKHCQMQFDTEELQSRIDSYFGDYVPDLIDEDDWMLQRFFTVRIVIPNQASVGRLLAFHQGIWVGVCPNSQMQLKQISFASKKSAPTSAASEKPAI